MAPGKVAVAGDWHGNTCWAESAIAGAAGTLPHEGGPRLILHCGDFGIWPGCEPYLSRVTQALEKARAHLWFVDGNHEDFSQLAKLQPGPDGREQVTDRIWHLPRGHRWRWHGRDWLALGGAVSLDRAGRTEGRDWWPEERITDDQVTAVISAGHADVMVTHECPSSVVHRFPQPPGWWDPADLARSDAHRERLQQVVDAVKPGWLMHGHLHIGYQREVTMAHGPVEVTGLNCDGSGYPHILHVQDNWAVLDVQDMTWQRAVTDQE